MSEFKPHGLLFLESGSLRTSWVEGKRFENPGILDLRFVVENRLSHNSWAQLPEKLLLINGGVRGSSRCAFSQKTLCMRSSCSQIIPTLKPPNPLTTLITMNIPSRLRLESRGLWDFIMNGGDY